MDNALCQEICSFHNPQAGEGMLKVAMKKSLAHHPLSRSTTNLFELAKPAETYSENAEFLIHFSTDSSIICGVFIILGIGYCPKLLIFMNSAKEVW